MPAAAKALLKVRSDDQVLRAAPHQVDGRGDAARVGKLAVGLIHARSGRKRSPPAARRGRGRRAPAAVVRRRREEKGDRHHLCEAPGTDRRLVGPFRQMRTVPFSRIGISAPPHAPSRTVPVGLLGEQRNKRSASLNAASSASSSTLKSARRCTATNPAPAVSADTRYMP